MDSLTFADHQVRKQYLLVKALAADLARIRRGEGPTADELEQAPMIRNWKVGMRAEPALFGSIEGHPSVKDFGVTSGLYLLDPELGYARTFSRFYRLGKEAVR